MRIPITMCHGIRPDGDRPDAVEHLDRLVGIAREMGFESIDYDDLAAWRDGTADRAGVIETAESSPFFMFGS